LLIDDSQAINQLLRARCEDLAGVESESAGSLAEAKALLAQDPGRFFAAVVDLNLPDSSEGEAIDLVQAHGIPAIVLTAHFDEALRERILAKEVIDCLLKTSPHEIDQWRAWCGASIAIRTSRCWRSMIRAPFSAIWSSCCNCTGSGCLGPKLDARRWRS